MEGLSQSQNIFDVILNKWALIAATIYYTYHCIKVLKNSPKGILKWLLLILLIIGVVLIFVLHSDIYNSIFIGISLFFFLAYYIYLFKKVNSLKKELAKRALQTISLPANPDNEIIALEDNRIKICLLLPLSIKKGREYVLGDVSLQLEGFSKVFLDRDNLSENFDFRVLDHKNDYDHALEIIKEQFKNGVNYFVCTMSQVAVKLAKKVNQEYESKPKKPILIFTVTGTTEISTDLNQENIFRFYIRINEEVDILKLEAEKHNSTGLIIIPSPYGYDVRELFVKKWNDSIGSSNRLFINQETDVITLPDDPNKISLKSALQKKGAMLKNKEVLLIALYGNAVYDIVAILDELRIKPQLLLFTSTFHFVNAEYEIKKKLKNYNWKSCVPKLETGLTYKEEVVKDFSYRVIDQLVKTIRDSNNSPEKFKDHWRKNYPKDLDISFENGDSKITLRMIDKSCI